MKKIFTIISLFFVIYTALAQPEINSLVINKPGQTIKYYEKEGDPALPGEPGENQVWDFSNVTFSNDDLKESKFEDPSKTPYASSFPEANLAKITGDEIEYYKSTSSDLTLVGVYSDNTFQYSDFETIAQAPLSYNDIDTILDYYTLKVGEKEKNGASIIIYDGYGTLKTSNGIYNNVVRLNERDANYTDEIYKESFSYYIPGYTIPLFRISHINWQKINYQEKWVTLFDPSFLTLNKNAYLQELKLSVNPNPANKYVNVDFKDLPSGEYNLKVTEQTGANVMSKNINVSKGEVHSLDIAELKSGLYFLEILSENGKVVKKIIKE